MRGYAICQLEFVILENCLEISTPWRVEDEHRRASPVASRAQSEMQRQNEARPVRQSSLTINKPADFVPNGGSHARGAPSAL
jgi:hypothetical protein